jgi:tetratricopeptide (TPR) repeat protein
MSGRGETCTGERRVCQRTRARGLVTALAIVVTALSGWLFLRHSSPAADDQYRRAAISAGQGDYDKAIAGYNAAIRINPRLGGAYRDRGYAWLQKGEYDRAIPDYSSAVRLNPDCARCYYGRAVAWTEKKEHDRAITDYDDAIRLEPRLAYAYYGRAVALSEKEKYEKAIGDYNRAIELDCTLCYAFYGRGCAWLQMGRYDRALPDYDHVLRLEPRLAPAYACRGMAREFIGRYAEAIADYDEAARLNAQMAFPYDRRAWILATCPEPGLRDGRLSIESAMKACELTNWAYPRLIETLAAAHAEAGDFNAAASWQTRAIALCTDSGERRRQFDRLALYGMKQPYRAATP